MNLTTAKSPLPSDPLVPLESILCTEELRRRPPRPPDYETENRALTALAQALADSPQSILQAMAEKMLEIFRCDSAGFSLLTKDEKRFYWAAIAGAWQSHLGGGTPRDFGPCGDVLDRNAPLLFNHWERRYPYLLAATPLAEEGLLVPFYVQGKAVGTIWAIAHDGRRQFDAEDLRQLESLGRFASAAYQAVESLSDREQRRAALNLMEDAVQSREAMEKLNMELRADERRFREMIDALPAAVYTTDADGRLTHFNPECVELSGRTPELGTDHWCVTWKLYYPDGTPMPHEECPMAIALKEGRPVRGAEAIAERPDGTRIWFAPYPTPLKDAEGKVVGGINMLLDITERKRAEEKLLASEYRFARFMQHLPGLAWTKDPDGRYVYANEAAEKAFRTPRAALYGKTDEEVFPPETAAQLRENDQRALASESGIQTIETLEHADGIHHHSIVSKFPIPGPDGQAVLVGGVAIDITERMRAEEALQESDRRKNEFLALLAHELRNPHLPP